MDTTRILEGSWKGKERNTVAWYEQQVDCLEHILSEDLDVQGLRAMLMEMATNKKNDVESLASTALEHLLKVKFGTQEYQKSHWMDEVRGALKQLRKLFIKRNKRGGRTNQDLINNYAEEIMQDAYNDALSEYKRDMRKNTSLRENFDKIPEDCPWTLMDIIEKDEDDLVDMI